MDECLYLTANGTEYKQRACTNSLLCDSPIRSFLDPCATTPSCPTTGELRVHQHLLPPATLVSDAARFRYQHLDPAALAVPIPTQRVWKRQYHDVRADTSAELMYQPEHTHEWQTHGGASITQPTWTDCEVDVLHAHYFHAYKMPDEHRDKYRCEEAIRDTVVSELLLDDGLWPPGTDEHLWRRGSGRRR